MRLKNHQQHWIALGELRACPQIGMAGTRLTRLCFPSDLKLVSWCDGSNDQKAELIWNICNTKTREELVRGWNPTFDHNNEEGNTLKHTWIRSITHYHSQFLTNLPSTITKRNRTHWNRWISSRSNWSDLSNL